MSRSLTNDTDSSDDEDMDGLTAAVLQDIEIKDCMNEGPEGNEIDNEKRQPIKQEKLSNDNNINNNDDNDDNENVIILNKKSNIKHQNKNHIKSKSESEFQGRQQIKPLNLIQKSSSAPTQKVNLYSFFNPLSPPLLSPKHVQQNTKPMIIRLHPNSVDSNNFTSTNSIIKTRSNNYDYRIDKQIAMKKIANILHEVDEDNNGEIDYVEFEEGLTNIDNNLLPTKIQQIYDECVWNEYDELNIQLFCDLLQQRFKTIDINKSNMVNKKRNKITPKSVIKLSFPRIFSDKSPILSISNNNNKPPAIWGQSDIESSLNKIHDILQEKDDDDNLYIDWNEFEEAMMDLGVMITRKNLKIVYSIIITKQSKNGDNGNNGDEKELNIKEFMFEISKLKGVETMKPNQILQQYFNPLISTKKHNKKYKPKNKFTFIDYDKNEFKKHIRSKTSISSNRIKPGSLNDIMELNTFHRQSHHKKKGKKHKRNRKHTRFQTHTAISTPFLFDKLASNNNNIHKKRTTLSSIMNKPNCSVIVISALKKQLKEVDEDNDGKVDWQEFNEVLSTLKSSFHGIKASKIFYNMADIKTHELHINKFMIDIKNMYYSYPMITGDECIDKISNKYKTKHQRNYSFGASSTQSAITNIIDEEKKEEINSNNNNNNIIYEIQEIMNVIVSDENGLIDKEEFIDFLSEWGIDEKLNENDLNLIFMELIEKEEEASCDLFMHRLHQLHTDHPNYSAKRAVYRVCRRLLKMAQNNMITGDESIDRISNKYENTPSSTNSNKQSDVRTNKQNATPFISKDEMWLTSNGHSISGSKSNNESPTNNKDNNADNGNNGSSGDDDENNGDKDKNKKSNKNHNDDNKAEENENKDESNNKSKNRFSSIRAKRNIQISRALTHKIYLRFVFRRY